MQKLISLMLLAPLFFAAEISEAPADTLSDIKAAGTIRIGVKADTKPWGFLDSDGKSVGMEIDLAQDVARRIGVRLEPVVVTSSNRIQFLQQGKIDLIIATMTDTTERRRVVSMVEPHYFASGTNVLAPKAANLRLWSDLSGKKVCGNQGSIYNKTASQQYGAEIIAFPGISEAQAALRAGNCVAFIYDDSIIQAILVDRATWGDYTMPLDTQNEEPWSIAIRLADGGSEYEKLLSQIVVDWHRNGALLEEMRKWGLQETRFLREAHDQRK
jgi:polar amino acid transport system substrate-binding protein